MGQGFKRVLLKISGEFLSGNKDLGIDFEVVSSVCRQIKKCLDNNIQVGLVIGGGNFWRGRSSGKMDRSKADYMGMLATVINALGVADTLEKMGVKAKVQTSIHMMPIAEPFNKDIAIKHLNSYGAVIFASGTGSPYFSTDTAAALRAAEINADIILKATLTDGIYDKDPNIYNDAKKYDTLTFTDILKNDLRVIDSSVASLCRDNNIPLLVFGIKNIENIFLASSGQNIGTLVK